MKISISPRRRLFDSQANKAVRYAVEVLEERTLLSTYVVTNPNNSGSGSLRDAIQQANSNSGLDLITFNIGGPTRTISPTFFLPPITDPVEIHGETQPGYASKPLIELNGSQAGSTNGLEFKVGGNLVEGLDIHNFSLDGIVFAEPFGAGAVGGNTVIANYLGTDISGTIPLGNQTGVHLIHSPHDVISGNVISGNRESGVFIADQFSSDTHIYGNKIGTDVTGILPLGNGLNGVALGAPPNPAPSDGFASHNFVGGNLPEQRNIISGNGDSGVWIEDGTDNTVIGNYIGVASDGTTPLGNGRNGIAALYKFGTHGVFIYGGTNNHIGGTDNGDGNVISANVGDGVRIDASDLTTSGNWVQGNLIGTDKDGNSGPNLGNYDGVGIRNTSTIATVKVSGNFIGGADADDGAVDGKTASRNIISGNLDDGILVGGDGVNDNLIEGNYIGTNKNGDKAVQNVNHGIELTRLSGQTFAPFGTLIGGVSAGAGNVISGNGHSGVAIENGATGTIVQGNRIGTTADGLGRLGNNDVGILIQSAGDNTFGGLTSAARNVISGNRIAGIYIIGSSIEAGSDNVLIGNYIGTDITGNRTDPDAQPGTGDELGNGQGIVLENAAGNTIGKGDIGGRNIISGNTSNGILIAGAFAQQNKIQANIIGMGADGTTKLGNNAGIYITQLLNGSNSAGSGSLNMIGGTATVGGLNIAVGNVIAANRRYGIDIDLGSSGNTVAGNFIGTGFAGTGAFGNGDSGIFISSAPSNTIGGTTDFARNIIVNNHGHGILIESTAATGNIVRGNYIGLGSDGSALPNTLDGVNIHNAVANTIGGGLPGGRNIISGNTGSGVTITGNSAASNQVLGNYIGTDPLGTVARPNGFLGVLIVNGAAANLVGAPGDSNRNVISGNANDGVAIVGDASNGTQANVVQNNYIGLNAGGTDALPNVGSGVHVENSPNNVIGGDAGAGNVISANAGSGVFMLGLLTTGTMIRGNYIGTDKDAARALGNQIGINLTFTATNSTTPTNTSIIGNVIGGNLKAGIYLNSEPLLSNGGVRGSVIQGNYIGTNPAMSKVIANHQYGILMFNADDNLIGGLSAGQGNVIAFTNNDNVISGDFPLGQGIEITGDYALRNSIYGNQITGNLGSGIRLSAGASNNIIGASGFGAGNIITLNQGNGIAITGEGTAQNTVQNNDIGIDAQGTARGNIVSGVRVFGGSHDNTIGGAGLAQGNVISANGQGVFILSGGHDNKVLGNYIGSDLLGAFRPDLGNHDGGVIVSDSPKNTIGGATDTLGGAPGNRIIGNTIGIATSGSAATGNVYQGNLIDKSTTNGVLFDSNTSNNLFGGTNALMANRISNSGGAGVYVNSGTGNAIRRNQIFDNTGLGIDLAPGGITPNDDNQKDADVGPNQLQNFPVLTTVTSASSNRIAGYLFSAPATTYTLEFFANTKNDPDAEGQRFLISSTITTNTSGRGFFDVSIPAGEIPGTYVTATATDPLGNTSEFSAAMGFQSDSDGDGIPDAVEDAGPSGGDANQDGTPDSHQGQVVSLHNAVDGSYVTLVAPSGATLSNVRALPNPSPDDAPINNQFDVGFFDFNLTGIAANGHADVQMTLANGRTPTTYYRFGPEPGAPVPHWYRWDFDGQTGAEINGNHITLHFVDGARGDDDLTANGTIVDIGGPSFPIRFTVTNTNDSGPGSLRQAILNSNAHFGQDVIDFNIGSGVQTIVPLSTLPTIRYSVTIDGTTQPGYSGKPIIQISGQSAPGAGLLVSAASTTIRGLVINRFSDYGIYIFRNSFTPFNFDIENNYLGTDVTGMLPMGNRWGIWVDAGTGVIGGTTARASNVISGNTVDGIEVTGSTSLQILGNLIGVAADGVTPLGNVNDGILIPANGATNTTVGGLDPGDANIIAFNNFCGVETWLPDHDNAILSNSIYANKVLGLGVGSGGIASINDSGAKDGTFSNAQNHPVLSSAISASGQTTISGYLNSQPNRTYLIQFFSNTTVTASGFGQGKTYLGTESVTTDLNGHVDFTATINAVIPDRQLITSTATDVAYNNTSDFSARLAVGDVLGNLYIVNANDDTDDGVADATHTSLREAILAANNHSGTDTIRFAIGSGVQTISLLTSLPAITDSVIIDGTTQPGFAGTPLIQISGTKMERTNLSGASQHLTAFGIFGNNSTIKGLDINSLYEFGSNSQLWGGTPIQIIGNNNVIVGNFIGTDVTGTISLPNFSGVLVNGTGNRIGGTTPAERNLISGNFNEGMIVSGTLDGPANLIEGNFIGTDVTGTKGLGNGRGASSGSFGVSLNYKNILGGTTPGAGNVISANLGDAVLLHEAMGTLIQGNFIGTDVTGTKKLGNAGGRGITYNENDFPAPTLGVTIGGIQAGARNIISNNSYGIFLSSHADIVQGNYIGTDITGTLDFGNLNDGVVVMGDNHTIGGTAPGAGNLISGNNHNGISLALANSSSGNVIQGNRIGTQADGVSPLGNRSDGIAVAADFSGSTDGTGPINNLIGGLDPAKGNIIAYNGRRGVDILAGQQIAILSNSIYSNDSLGIDLNGDGVSLNDGNDVDAGDNNLQNYPVLATVVTDGTHTTVTGSFNGAPGTAFMLQFFANAADASGHGQGQTLLGTRQIITDPSGNATFTMNFPVSAPIGQFISATATDPLGNTSEFSGNLQIVNGTVAPNQPPNANAGGSYTINEGDPLTLDASLSADPDGDSLTISWDVNGDGVFGDATGAKPSLTWAQLETLGIFDGPGSFTVKVRVDDGHGHVVTSPSTTLTVVNVAPTVSVGQNVFVTENDPVSLTGTFTDPGTADTFTFLWHVVANNGQTISDGHSQNFNFTPPDNGFYTVTFTVTDDDGASNSATLNVIVANALPVVAILGAPAQSTIGVPISLMSSVTDVSPVDTAAGFQDSWSVSLETNFNVVFTGKNAGFSFTPALPGTYDVFLFVRDKDGGSSSVSTKIYVPYVVTGSIFTPGGSGHEKLTVAFGHTAGPAAFSTADFTIKNALTGATIDSTNMAVTFDPTSQTATITFPGLPGAHLPDGRYHLTVAGANNYRFNFFRLTGDANQDATVNFSDLIIVAQNYGKTDSRLGWSDGEFTGDGGVSFADLVALAQNYGRTLSPLPAPPSNLPLPQPAPLPTPATGSAAVANQTNTAARSTEPPSSGALQETPSLVKPAATSPHIVKAQSAIAAKPQSAVRSQASRFSRARLTTPANHNSVVTSATKVGITPVTVTHTPNITSTATPPSAPILPLYRKRSVQDEVFS